MNPIEIVLADDHHLVRQGVCALLEADPDLRIVGEASTGLETCRLVKDLKPDVLLVDLRMPNLNGLEVAGQLTQRKTRTRVVILTMYDNDAYVLEALKNGASGYILKDCTATDFLHAVHEVAAGGRYLSEVVSRRAIEAYIEESKHPTKDIYHTLTNRESEVLHLVAKGYTNAQVAEQLSISPRTVEVHRASMMHKLGLKTQTDLIRYAIGRGIISTQY